MAGLVPVIVVAMTVMVMKIVTVSVPVMIVPMRVVIAMIMPMMMIVFMPVRAIVGLKRRRHLDAGKSMLHEERLNLGSFLQPDPVV